MRRRSIASGTSLRRSWADASAGMAVIVAFGDSTTAGTPGFQSPIEAPPDGAGNVESQFAYWLMQAHPDVARLKPRSERRTRRPDSRPIPSRHRERETGRRDRAGRRKRYLPGPERRVRGARARRDVLRGSRVAHPDRRGDDCALQHGDCRRERAHARGECVDRRIRRRLSIPTWRSPTRARRSPLPTMRIGSCPRQTACIRPRTVTGEWRSRSNPP